MIAVEAWSRKFRSIILLNYKIELSIKKYAWQRVFHKNLNVLDVNFCNFSASSNRNMTFFVSSHDCNKNQCVFVMLSGQVTLSPTRSTTV